MSIIFLFSGFFIWSIVQQLAAAKLATNDLLAPVIKTAQVPVGSLSVTWYETLTPSDLINNKDILKIYSVNYNYALDYLASFSKIFAFSSLPTQPKYDAILGVWNIHCATLAVFWALPPAMNSVLYLSINSLYLVIKKILYCI